MASIGITASLQRACSSQHITKKTSTQARPTSSLGTKQVTKVVTPNLEALKLPKKHETPPSVASNEIPSSTDSNKASASSIRFSDARWKNGTWDLNMFVKEGRMDWDSVILAGNIITTSSLLCQNSFSKGIHIVGLCTLNIYEI